MLPAVMVRLFMQQDMQQDQKAVCAHALRFWSDPAFDHHSS
jgi:hypothetical protein